MREREFNLTLPGLWLKIASTWYLLNVSQLSRPASMRNIRIFFIIIILLRFGSTLFRSAIL